MMLSEETVLALEIQYIAMQDLMEESGEFPTRDEVNTRFDLMTQAAAQPSNVVAFKK